MNDIDKLKVRAKTIRSLKGKINGDVEDIDFKTTMSDESKQLELEEDGIPYCKRKKSYPDWAKYKATDEDGEVCIYEKMPDRKFSVWDYGGYRFKYIKTKNPPKDWIKTLRRIRDKE